MYAVSSVYNDFRSSLPTFAFIRSSRWVSLVEQELLTLPVHLSSAPVFSGVRVTQSLVFCVMFCRSWFVPFFLPLCCPFFFDIRILITSLWYLQTLLIYVICIYLRILEYDFHVRLSYTTGVTSGARITLPGHLSSVFSGVHVAKSLVFCLSSPLFLMRFVLLDLLLFSQFLFTKS